MWSLLGRVRHDVMLAALSGSILLLRLLGGILRFIDPCDSNKRIRRLNLFDKGVMFFTKDGWFVVVGSLGAGI
jgi:hypothetical protein